MLHIIPFLGCCWLSVVLVSIDFHPEKPCFSVRFVDTYSIHSFPPPSRRTQQIQPFSQSGAYVCPVVQIFASFADKNFTCFKRQHLYCDTTWLLDTPAALCTPHIFSTISSTESSDFITFGKQLTSDCLKPIIGSMKRIALSSSRRTLSPSCPTSVTKTNSFPNSYRLSGFSPMLPKARAICPSSGRDSDRTAFCRRTSLAL